MAPSDAEPAATGTTATVDDDATTTDPTDPAGATAGAGDEAAEGARADGGRDGDAFDLRGLVKQFTAPMIESLDARLREQVEAHADALLDEKVDAAVSDRLATIERAIADVSRSLADVEQRLGALERSGEPADLE